MNDTLVIDFETYYDGNITLRKMNYSEYVQRTHILCLGYIYQGRLNVLHDPRKFLASLNWSTITVIGHNLLFDALVLKSHYGHTAARYIDTLGMARAIHPCRKHGLDDLADLYAPALKKTQALKYVKGKTWGELTEQQQTELKQYCQNDVVLTAMLYDQWKHKFHEYNLLDHTIKLFINPRLELNSTKLEALILEEKLEADRLLTLHKLSREKVRSDAQFAEHLSSMGYIVPSKFSAKQQKVVPAFAKNDSQWQEFYLHNPELQPLLDLKRSINSSIKETRTNRLITSITDGKLPVAYNYHGAFTGRFCITGDTVIQVLRDEAILNIMITELLNTDLVWDGEEFVTHGGLVYQGEREIMTYDGITGTPDHRVWVEEISNPVELRTAAERNYTLKVARNPQKLPAHPTHPD